MKIDTDRSVFPLQNYKMFLNIVDFFQTVSEFIVYCE